MLGCTSKGSGTFRAYLSCPSEQLVTSSSFPVPIPHRCNARDCDSVWNQPQAGGSSYSSD